VDTTVRDPLVGRVLDGRYRVESRLARGGMATVYTALDSRLDRTIALKVMHANLAEDDEFVSRFIREAKSAARLSHPNVVAVYDQGADDGHVFLAMEHVPGRTLRDLLRDRTRLTPRQALEVLEPMLAALGAAHHAGIVHRDVKPENVLLADDGGVMVADFGLARAVATATSHTNSGILLGTVNYLAPEQVERGIADPRSDVYAAGIVLYEMLTGVKPHDAETAIQVAYRHVHEDVPPPSQLAPDVPAELDALVARATDRNPDGRPADARRFLTEVVAARRSLSDEELDAAGPPLAALTAQPVDHTRVVGATPPLGLPREQRSPSSRSAVTNPTPRPPKRRRRGPLALLLVLLLALVLSFAAWYWAAGPGSYVDAPSLLKMTRAAADQKATRLGFDTRVAETRFSETLAKGLVLATDPSPGDNLKKDGVIGLVLSRGPERYDVPDLTGKTEAAARAELEATHLSVGQPSTAYSDTVEEGSVISTTPEPGTSVRRDAAVTLVVSKGIEPVAVPNVTGKSLDDARAALAEGNLRAKVVAERFNDQVAEGDVIKQTPAGEGTAPKNSVVRLVVSKGPPLVAVPDVRGRSIGEARTILENAGFHVRAVGFGGGTVRGQTPNSGVAPRGSTINLVYL
jgi:serine/threonine-protein kinase